MTGFVLRAVIAAFGLWLATLWVDGLVIDDSISLLLSAALLGIVNAFVRPVTIFLTLPVTVVTLGFFLLVVNAGMLALVAALVVLDRILGLTARQPDGLGRFVVHRPARLRPVEAPLTWACAAVCRSAVRCGWQRPYSQGHCTPRI